MERTEVRNRHQTRRNRGQVRFEPSSFLFSFACTPQDPHKIRLPVRKYPKMTLHGAGFRKRRGMQATRGSSCLLEAWFARYMRRISQVYASEMRRLDRRILLDWRGIGWGHPLAGGVHPLSGVAHPFYYCEVWGGGQGAVLCPITKRKR